MVTQNTDITKNSLVDDFINNVKLPAYNSAVYWNSNYPSYIQSSQLGDRDVSTPTTADIPDSVVTASTIVNVFKAYAKVTTSYRLARSGLILDGGGVSQDSTNVCRLLDSYQVNYVYSDGDVISGNTITANSINSFYTNLRNVAAAAQTTETVIDLRVCHSSCHVSCHSSRGRR